jgi:hypothetical protein
MRSTLVFGLTLLVSAGAVGAENEKPIPQDFARMEKQRRDLLEWNLRTTLGAYDQVGKKDGKWDKPAREAMDLAARMFSQQVDPTITYGQIYNAAKAAIDAGCDDPYLVYLSNRSTVGPNFPGAEEATRRMSVSARSLEASRYPAFRRAGVLVVAGGFELAIKPPTEASRKEGERSINAALALLPESVASDERTMFWEEKWYYDSMACIRGYITLGMDAPAAFQRVDAELAKLPELKVLRLQVKGAFWQSYGWEARTQAFAPLVPEAKFQTFEQRLLEARDAFEEAWKLRPDDARTAGKMLDIEKAIGGDRATMELWFERALKANGDQRDACWSKLDWLDPKWHGTTEEMMAFGRACGETRNWRAGITLLLADAHNRFQSKLPPEERSKYMSSPEVWSDIKSVFDEYLKHHPNDHKARSKYAALSYAATHYPEAHAQFEILGDRLTQWADFPFYPLEALKQMRAQCAQMDANKRSQGAGTAKP